MNTYDPKKVVVTFKGFVLSGYADGTFISIVPAGDNFTKVVGADGEVSRSKSNDDTAEVSLTLQQTSLSNDVLSAEMNADKLANTGVGPLIVKDLAGLTVFFASEAWIRTPPDQAYSKEIEDREWIFDTGNTEIAIGGSSL